MEAERARGVMPLAADRLFHQRIAEEAATARWRSLKNAVEQRTGHALPAPGAQYDTPRSGAWRSASIARSSRQIARRGRRRRAGACAANEPRAKRFSSSWDKRQGPR